MVLDLILYLLICLITALIVKRLSRFAVDASIQVIDN